MVLPPYYQHLYIWRGWSCFPFSLSFWYPVINQLPSDALPVDVIVQENGCSLQIEDWWHPISITVKLSKIVYSFQSYIASHSPYTSQLFSPDVFQQTFFCDPANIFHMLLDPEMILRLATGGGAVSRRTSYGFSLSTSNGQVLWTASGHCLGFWPTSFCSEATLITAATELIAMLFAYITNVYPHLDAVYEYTFQSPPPVLPILSAKFVVIHCDNKRLLTRLVTHSNPLIFQTSVLKSKWDLTQHLYNSLNTFSHCPDLECVKGQQGDAEKNSRLPTYLIPPTTT